MTHSKMHYFLSGIGGSGMLPLAHILKGLGHQVSGSDRGRDQGRSPEKFAALELAGMKLFPQDGSGVKNMDALVVSAAVEDDVPDVVAANAANIPVMRRAQLLADLFNAFPKRIAVGGTSGKTTVTGMIAFILREAGLDPTVMCGGMIKNYKAAALVGKGDVFVTEADESDGSIALYSPDIAVLNNISVDHKGMEELRELFGDFTRKARIAVINADDTEAAALKGPNAKTFGFGTADIHADDVFHLEEGSACVIHGGKHPAPLSLDQQGDHNIANAMAAIAAVVDYGVPVAQACDILGRFQGIKRRMEWVGEGNGITVIDDFAHNPDKITATLTALKKHPGRLLVFFQMHGYGPLKLMGKALGETFRDQLGAEDRLFVTEPLYLGGTADTSQTMQSVVNIVGPRAALLPDRDEVKKAILNQMDSGDRIIVMGARDDTLSDFAADLLQSIRK